MKTKKILVAGGGPAGLNCAYWASKDGCDVTVFEKESELARKPCGELIPDKALDLIPLDNNSSWVLNRVKRCLIYHRGEFIRELKPPPEKDITHAPTKGYSIDKKGFLEDLKSVAESAGAEVHFNKKATHKNIRNEKFDMIIDATGYPRVLGRSVGVNDGSERLAPCKMGYYRGELDPDTTILNLLDKGYAWLFPHDELINFGVGGFYDKKTLENLYEKNIRTFELKPSSEDLKPRTTSIFLGGPINQLRKGKLTIAGEAAGTTMPTNGEGIRFALWSGSICYKENYEELFTNEYGRKLKFGRKLLEVILELSNEERLKIAENGSLELFSALAEGDLPRIRDLAQFPWLVRYLRKL